MSAGSGSAGPDAGRRGARGERADRRRRRSPAVSEVNLFRYVEGTSPIHGLWAGTKIVALVAVGIAVSFHPTWAAQALVLGALAACVALARVPLGAVPRFPRWFWIGVLITLVSASLAGGKPNVHIGHTSIGLGGFDEWCRLTLLVAILIGSTALVGWTTRAADLTPALATLGAPARRLRVPVDEIALVVALAVRCMPLLVEEMRTMAAARRLRNPPTPETFREIGREINDLLVTALVSSARRAQEMSDAIEARGGVGSVRRSGPALRPAEVVAWVVTAGLVVGAALL